MKKLIIINLALVLMLIVNGCGGGGANSEISQIPTTPNSPTNVLATLIDPSSADVTFTAPNSDGGSAITQYKVVAQPGNLTASGKTNQIKISGLSIGTTYRFTVTANNVIGQSQPSAQSNALKPSLKIDGSAPMMLKVGSNTIFGVEKFDGIYLQKYDSTYKKTAETKIHAGDFFYLNQIIALNGQDEIAIFSTEAIDASSARLKEKGKSQFTIIDVSSFTVKKNVTLMLNTEMLSVSHLENDSFFQVLVTTGSGQFIKKIDLQGNIINNIDLWSSLYHFKHIKANANNIFLVGNKYLTGGGERACILILDNAYNVIDEHLQRPFAVDAMTDNVYQVSIDSNGLRMTMDYQESNNMAATSTIFNIDQNTGSLTPIFSLSSTGTSGGSIVRFGNDDQGNFYVAEVGTENSIIKISPTGQIIWQKNLSNSLTVMTKQIFIDGDKIFLLRNNSPESGYFNETILEIFNTTGN